MRPIGIGVASRSGLSPARLAIAARDSEDAGCNAFFISERTADAVTLSQLALAATTTIRVGTAVANAGVRHPALTAMTAATLAEAYGGRFTLGLGIANRHLNQTVLGVPAPASELSYMREYVGVLRSVLGRSGGRVTGAAFQVGPLALDRVPNAEVPILLAGLLPRMLQLAAEVADGVILNLTTVSRLATVEENLAIGAARGGRDRGEVSVSCMLPTCLSDDTEAARRAATDVVVGYAQHPAARQLFRDSGFGPEMDAICASLAEGDRDRAAGLAGGDLVDAFVLHGTEADCLHRIDAYRAAGVNLPILFPMPVHGDWDGAINRAIQLATHAL